MYIYRGIKPSFATVQTMLNQCEYKCEATDRVLIQPTTKQMETQQVSTPIDGAHDTNESSHWNEIFHHRQ